MEASKQAGDEAKRDTEEKKPGPDVCPDFSGELRNFAARGPIPNREIERAATTFRSSFAKFPKSLLSTTAGYPPQGDSLRSGPQGANGYVSTRPSAALLGRRLALPLSPVLLIG